VELIYEMHIYIFSLDNFTKYIHILWVQNLKTYLETVHDKNRPQSKRYQALLATALLRRGMVFTIPILCIGCSFCPILSISVFLLAPVFFELP